MILVEIGFLIGGIYALVTGKLPSFLWAAPSTSWKELALDWLVSY
jgi:hypothetical protein